LAEVAQRHDLAIISDEVFSEFLLQSRVLPRPAAASAPLVFTLNGFSKMLALPGIKLGWLGVSGSPNRVEPALKALELISDTFLPVNEIVQAAVPDILKGGMPFLSWYGAQVRERWRQAEEILKNTPHCDFVSPEGGFYVTLHLRNLDEERVTLELLDRHHLLVHPGYFYDIEPHHLVLSFIQRAEVIEDALTRLAACLESLHLRGTGLPTPNPHPPH
jgi:hypothetical protein